MNNTIKLYLLFSHTLTEEQERDARERFGIDEIILLPKVWLDIWSQVPAQSEKVKPYLKEIFAYLDQVNKDDFVLIQGDFGATYMAVNHVKEKGATPIYATTQRNVVEKQIGNKSIKTSVFKHIRYRVYGE